MEALATAADMLRLPQGSRGYLNTEKVVRDNLTTVAVHMKWAEWIDRGALVVGFLLVVIGLMVVRRQGTGVKISGE